MPVPVHLSFLDMEPIPALEEFVGQWVVKLEHVYKRIERCDVVIERPHRHQRQGEHIHVRVTLAVPGPDVVISHDHSINGSHEDAYVALRDAFRAARRRLEDHVRRQRQDVKERVEPEHGRVTYVDAEGEWGYLETAGRQVYFHRNSVLDAKPLAVGDEVRFDEEPGMKGPQATSVARVGEHGRHQMQRR